MRLTWLPNSLLDAFLKIIILCLCSTTSAQSGTRIDLTGEWQLRLDPAKRGEQLEWPKQMPGETETVRVPHTWNIGRHDDYEGTAWYFRTFALPEELLKQHTEIHFAATFYKSRIWLNGALLGGHEGGHTAYFFDATLHLRAVNLLAVEINNQPTTQTIPGWAMKLRGTSNLWYDWWHYGGIVRDVWLTVNDTAVIRRQQIRVKVEGNAAAVTDKLFVENFSRKPTPAKVVLKAWTPDGRIAAATVEQAVSLAPGLQEITLALRLEPVRLWHFDDPQLYRMEVSLLDSRNNLLDLRTDSFGARTIEIRNRQLYLNGERVRLTGMTRHEDSPWEGLAESVGTIRHDYDDLKRLQATLTRPVHYPQHEAILDYCDRNGILLIPEIPMWQFSEQQMSDRGVIDLAKQMMREMIEQAYNHPSIFAWSVCNESATNTPGGRAYFKTMYDFVKQLDPDRFVTYADDRIAFVDDATQNAASLADFIMWNQYFGTWHGPESLLASAIERISQAYPGKMVIISEMGAAGFFRRDSEEGDQLRAHILRTQLETLGKHDWIAGAIMWCYQDYKSHRNLWPGEDSGYVEMGLVDEFRQRRPSYELWRELNSPARIALEWHYDPARKPVGFRARIERRGSSELPSYTLRNYRLAWELHDDANAKIAGGEEDLPEIGPPHSVAGSWPVAASKSLRLSLRLYRPTGFTAAETALGWWDPRSGGFDVEKMRQRGLEVPP